jgi:hypothetical protein
MAGLQLNGIPVLEGVVGNAQSVHLPPQVLAVNVATYSDFVAKAYG